MKSFRNLIITTCLCLLYTSCGGKNDDSSNNRVPAGNAPAPAPNSGSNPNKPGGASNESMKIFNTRCAVGCTWDNFGVPNEFRYNTPKRCRTCYEGVESSLTADQLMNICKKYSQLYSTSDFLNEKPPADNATFFNGTHFFADEKKDLSCIAPQTNNFCKRSIVSELGLYDYYGDNAAECDVFQTEILSIAAEVRSARP